MRLEFLESLQFERISDIVVNATNNIFIFNFCFVITTVVDQYNFNIKKMTFVSFNKIKYDGL